MTDLEYLKKYFKGDLNEALDKLKKGIPVQYIVGDVDFYGYNFIVNEDVLIPRFETEQLVSKVLTYIDENNLSNLDILDLCTGSGCIAITLSLKLKSSIDASDISSKALKVATRNNEKNNSDVTFYLGNLLEPINKKYDIIISNPPYIAYGEEIMDIVKNNEPSIALYADNNGLYYYEEILKTVKKNLKDKYLIAFEIGYKQGEDILKLAHKYLDCEAQVYKDLQNKDRFVFIKNKA